MNHGAPTDTLDGWDRLAGLLTRYYPQWRLGDPILGAPAQGLIRPLTAVRHDDDSISLRFEILLPLEYLAAGDSAFGKADREFPDGLWPLQLSLALCLRLRMLGWWAELAWPGGLVIDGTPIGGVQCGRTERYFRCRVSLRLGTNRGSKIPPRALEGAACGVCLDGLILSFVQALIAVLESPWPRRRMLNFYQDWCVTLGTKVAGPDDTGQRVEGIACSVREDGALSMETLAGKPVRLPVTESDFGSD